MNKAILFFLVPFLILTACGDTTVTPNNSDQTSTVEPVEPYGDPPDYTGDPFENFPGSTGLSIPGEVEVEYEEEILTGTHFTIQISAATTEETAQRLAESVSAEINYPVFVDHLGGYWKVRVGAFPAREDAVAYTRVLVDMGFTDAWVTTREP
jgi:cell division septation protein DedD